MRALHVIAGLSLSSGGPSYSVPRLCESLRSVDWDAELFSVQDEHSRALDRAVYFKQDASWLPILSKLRFSGALRRGLRERAMNVDVVHNHGLWLMPNVYAGQAAFKARRPLVVSPRGMLAKAALNYSPRKKALFWSSLQRDALASAAAWHATSADEADDIRSFGIRAPIAVIPNGVDLPNMTAAHCSRQSSRSLLFLSRLHPKKGLPDLISAWSRVALHRPDWHLTIAGPDEGGHRAELEAQISQLAVPRIKFLGAVFGSEKFDLLAAADLFVLPTQNENFGIAVAEALASGLPAIVTKGAPWSGLRAERCGWWIDHGTDALVAALLEATSLPSEVRCEMGARGRAWMLRDFGWDAIGERMASLYEWINASGAQPEFVRAI